VVMGMVVVTAIILWIFDSILTWLVKTLTGQGG
jgi:preprotein translocase subunit SecE